MYKNYGVIFHFCTSQVSLSQNPNKMLPVVASTAGAAATEARHGFNAEHAADCPCKIGVRLNLWTAAARGDVDRLRELLGGGAPTEVDKGDDYGHTALHGAAVAGHAAAVAVLLAAGAQVDNAVCGATPLHRAAALGRRDVVTALLAAGASVAVRDSSTGDLRTPLAKAAVGGHTAIVADLLAAGSDVGAVDVSGRTPWQLAALHGHVEAAAVLAAAGADTTPLNPVATAAPVGLPPPPSPPPSPPPPAAAAAAPPARPAASLRCAVCDIEVVAAQFVPASALPTAAGVAVTAVQSSSAASVPVCLACCRTLRIPPPAAPLSRRP